MAAAPPEDCALHARLLAGDPVVSSEIAVRFLEPLYRRLKLRFPLPRHDDIVRDNAVDAVLRLAEHPHRYDPGRLAIDGYLWMDARGDILNRIHSPAETRLTPVPLADVEHFLTDGNDPSAGLEELVLGGEDIPLPEGLDRRTALAQIVAAFPDERDRRALLLLDDGERHTSVFAALFGVAHLDAAGQEREVKRRKDRIKMKRKRLLNRLRLAGAGAPRPAAHAEGGDGGL